MKAMEVLQQYIDAHVQLDKFDEATKEHEEQLLALRSILPHNLSFEEYKDKYHLEKYIDLRRRAREALQKETIDSGVFNHIGMLIASEMAQNESLRQSAERFVAQQDSEAEQSYIDQFETVYQEVAVPVIAKAEELKEYSTVFRNKIDIFGNNLPKPLNKHYIQSVKEDNMHKNKGTFTNGTNRPARNPILEFNTVNANRYGIEVNW